MSTGSRTLGELPDLLTMEEAREVLRIGRNQIYAAVNRGEIHAVKIGNSWRVPRAAIERLIDGEPADAAAV